MTSAFVTGGSGFIGGALVRRLVDEGMRVRALARSDDAAARVALLGAEPVTGSLDDVAGMTEGARSCELAFHCAAHLGDWGSPEAFERGNVTGTRNALQACRAAGVGRFVHVGTEAALLDGAPLVAVDERAPLRFDSPRAVLVDQGARRGGRARGRARRPGDRWSCARASSGARATRRSCPSSPRWCARAASRGSAAGTTSRRPRTSTTSSRACCSPRGAAPPAASGS